MTSASLALIGWSASPGRAALAGVGGAALAEALGPGAGWERRGGAALAGRSGLRPQRSKGRGCRAVAGERTRTVSVRLSPIEHANWVAAARGAGRGRLGSWVRDRVAATLVPSAGASVSGDDSGAVAVAGSGLGVSVGEWAGLRAELGRVGNNLNQAVRVANSSGVNPARVAEMADAAAGTRFAVAGLLAAVRAVTGVGPVGAPVVGSRSVDQQLADADAERRFEGRVRVAAERLYMERIARGQAALAARAAALRGSSGATPAGQPPVGGSGP